MPAAPLPTNETERLAALRELDVLDTAPESPFDGLVGAASSIAGTPVSLVSLVDENRQWFKAAVGLGEVRQTDRCDSFCAHTILQQGAMEVRDALLDERFADNPLVLTDPRIRFYCGVPIKLSCGSQVGSLCVIDFVPRSMTEDQLRSLGYLAVATASALEGRKATLQVIEKTNEVLASEASLARANLALRQVNEDMRSFVKLASHDLKAPLVTVRRLAEWTMDAIDEGDSHAAGEHLALLGKRITRMETLLADLTQLTNVGKDDAPLVTIDTWEAVTLAFGGQGQSEGFELVLAGESSQITTQAAPLNVVLHHLMRNAIKHRRDKGTTLHVTTTPDPSGESVKFTLVDDGPGIAPEFHETVFEPLRMLQSRDETEGSGLGLTIVKQTVEQVGGSISLESDGVSGTTVRLVWPVTPR